MVIPVCNENENVAPLAREIHDALSGRYAFETIFVDDGSQLGDASAREETFAVCDQYAIQGDLFSEAVRSGKPVEFPLENAVQNMRVIDALFRSAKSGGWETVAA